MKSSKIPEWKKKLRCKLGVRKCMSIRERYQLSALFLFSSEDVKDVKMARIWTYSFDTKVEFREAVRTDAFQEFVGLSDEEKLACTDGGKVEKAFKRGYHGVTKGSRKQVFKHSRRKTGGGLEVSYFDIYNDVTLFNF